MLSGKLQDGVHLCQNGLAKGTVYTATRMVLQWFGNDSSFGSVLERHIYVMTKNGSRLFGTVPRCQYKLGINVWKYGAYVHFSALCYVSRCTYITLHTCKPTQTYRHIHAPTRTHTSFSFYSFLLVSYTVGSMGYGCLAQGHHAA